MGGKFLTDEEKANQLVRIATNFEDTINMTRLINLIKDILTFHNNLKN